LATALLIEPRFQDQELYFPSETESMRSLAYWEGAVTVLSADRSQHVGRGYVELTGYAR
jgi:predicted secreted hydrolase